MTFSGLQIISSGEMTKHGFIFQKYLDLPFESIAATLITHHMKSNTWDHVFYHILSLN
jgi:hypothetical protein